MVTPSPTAATTPSPVREGLRWEQVGVVGGGDVLRDEYDELVFLVAFDAGYLLFVRGTGSYEQWINRIWFSADGTSWEDVTPVGVELTLGHSATERPVATDGSSVLLIARNEGYVGGAWMTDDGRNWRQTAHDLLPDHDWAALTAWATPTGWQSIFYENYVRGCDNDFFTCFRTTVWESLDGVEWSRLSTIVRDDVDFANAASADGTIVASLPIEPTHMFSSSDGGASWEPLKGPAECQGYGGDVIGPSPSLPMWLTTSVDFDGSAHICTSPDLLTWRHVQPPALLKLFSVQIAMTDGGYLVTVGHDCAELGACPPHYEQWLTRDGSSWTPIRVPDHSGRPAYELLVSSGPSGVLGVTSRGPNSSVLAWRLVIDD